MKKQRFAASAKWKEFTGKPGKINEIEALSKTYYLSPVIQRVDGIF